MRKPVLLALGAVVVIAALAVGGVLLFTGEDGEDGDDTAATCDNAVSVYFVDDQQMQAAAAKLRADERVGRLRTETRAQAGKRLDAKFPDSPAAGPALTSVMAAVHLAAAAGIDHIALAEDLAGELPKATGAEPVDCPPAKRKPDFARYVHEEPCGRVNVYFDTDEAMLAAKDVVAADPKVESVQALTKEQSYERAKEIFADDPELLQVLTPENLPAALELLTTADPDEQAGKLEGSLQGVENARSQPCLALPHPVADTVR